MSKSNVDANSRVRAYARGDFASFFFFFIFALQLRLECYTSVMMMHIALLIAKELQENKYVNNILIMSRVVYLLGAGASFGTREKGIGSPIVSGLPIVCEIEGELESMAHLLASLPLNDKELEECKQRLIKDFQDLKEQCAGLTIDSYAKKLWLQNDM